MLADDLLPFVKNCLARAVSFRLLINGVNDESAKRDQENREQGDYENQREDRLYVSVIHGGMSSGARC